jgi:hypothetical protein
MDSRGTDRGDLNGKENTAAHDSATNVHILAKRKLKRDGTLAFGSVQWCRLADPDPACHRGGGTLGAGRR